MATDTAAMTEAAIQVLSMPADPGSILILRNLPRGYPCLVKIDALQALADNWLATVNNKDEYERIMEGIKNA